MEYKDSKLFSIAPGSDAMQGVKAALDEREIRDNLDSISVFSLPTQIRGARRLYSLSGTPKKVLIVLTIRKQPRSK